MTKGYIYYKTRKNTIAMLFWAVLLFVLFVIYLVSAFIYLPNAHTSGHELDSADLMSNVKMLTVDPQSEAFDTREYSVIVPPFIRLNELYVDGLKYRFQFTLESYKEAGFGYGVNEDKTLRILYGNPETKSLPPNTVDKVGIISIQGIDFVALLPAGAELKPGETVKRAVFSKLPLYVGHDLGMTDYADTEVPSYIVDLRGLTVEDESVDFALIIIFTLLFPSFLIYGILCLFKPNIHPNYLRIAKFGDVEKICAEIDEEITQESTHKEKKQVYTEHYIIEETLYNTRVRKNHLLRH